MWHSYIHKPLVMSKNNLDLIQELFESKLDSLNDKIDTFNRTLVEKIDRNDMHSRELLLGIKSETSKTNGTVIRIDNDLKELTKSYNNHLLESASTEDIKEITRRIDKIDDDAFIVKIFNKYPKQLVVLFVATVLMSLATLGYTMITVQNVLKDVKPNISSSK